MVIDVGIQNLTNMKNLTTLFFLLFSLISFGQFQLTVDASVLDRSTKQHIPHVSIGIADKGIGTVSDAEGNFVLILNQDEVNENDRIEFSATGYNSRKIKLSVFLKYLFHSNKIFLDPEAMEPMVASNEVETFGERFEIYIMVKLSVALLKATSGKRKHLLAQK